MTSRSALLWGGVIALALSARFVFETALVNRLPAALAVCAAVVPASLALAGLSFGLPGRSRLGRRDLVLAVVAGALGIWASPFLVASVRSTDAPSGTEVLFLTSAVWGLLLVASGLLARGVKPDPARIAGALLGVVAAAGVLANWERPSSFSPFVKFPREEAVIILAGVAFVAAVRILEGLVRRHGALAAMRPVALSGAAAALLAAAALSHGRLAELASPGVWTFAGPAAVAVFALLLAWPEALAERPPEVLSAAYFLPPALLSALSFVEHATSSLGPDPIRWHAAGPAIALALAAATLVAWPWERETGWSEGTDVTLARRAARVAAGFAVAAALVGLVSPDVMVSVRGILSSGAAFQTSYAMLGFETAGGWLALCCSLLASALAWRAPGSGIKPLLAALALAAVVWVPLHATPLHTWNRWIPPEVQQDYGTEYAMRTEQLVTDPWELLALGGAVSSGALLLTGRRRSVPEVLPEQEVSR